MATYTLTGQLTLRSVGEADDILHCGPEVVTEWAEMLTGKQVSLRWWISNICESDEAIKQRALEQVLGRADIEWGARYSAVTGYLWTDEKLKVGGHDMIDRLKSDVGKYLLLEVEVHS
jgi:hypothetical protein